MSGNYRRPPRVSFYLMDDVRAGSRIVVPWRHARLDPSATSMADECRKALAAAIDHGHIRRAGDYLCVVSYSDQSNAVIVLTAEESHRPGGEAK